MWVLLAQLACTTPPPREEPVPAGPPVPVDVESQGFDADLARTTAFLKTRPREERPLHVTGFERVEGLPDLSAKTCGTCHTAIYEQWQTSIHAAAWIDRQYQGEIAKSGNRWLCLNCHTPLLSQHDKWPVGLVADDVEAPQLVANPKFDEALRDEGITCAACHVKDGAIRGPGLGGTPPHPVVVDPTLQSGELCMECHQAERTYAGKSFICTFKTGEEWRRSPYPAEGKNCTTCHMPRADMPAAVNGPVRSVGQHWWKGAGIPKVKGIAPPPEANVPGLDIQTRVDGAELELTLTNANAGHMLPTGDPERWVQVDVTFETLGGEIGEPWQIKFMQTWEWSTPPKKVGDSRLAPRESRVRRIAIPAGAREAVVEASSHRISKENAEFHHLGDYPRSIQTHRQVILLP